MAQSGYTPISLYYSSVTGSVPTAGQVVNGELAINIRDGKLYYKDAAGAVTLLASSSGAAIPIPVTVPYGGTGLTTLASGRIPYGNVTGALQSSASLYFDGTTLFVGPGSALGGTTNPFLAVTGNADQYIQQYIFNANSGTHASADFVAYPDNGADSAGWMDMGIASSTFADTAYSVTTFNEGYLFMSAPSGASKSGNLVYATDSTGTTNAHQWYVGGFNQAKSAWEMQLTSTSLNVATKIGIGTTSPSYSLDIQGTGAGASISGQFANLTVLGNSGTNVGGLLGLSRSRGTTAAPTIVGVSDQIGVLYFNAYNGSAYNVAAQIEAFVDATPGVNDMPGRLTFSTTADGASAPTERMRITSAGGISFGSSGTAYGTSGQVLTSAGNAPPTWTTPTTGTVTSITAGTGLTGGTITSSGTIAIDTSVVATLTGAQTLTNKRVTPRIGTTTSAATITPTGDSSDQYNVTALATTANFAAPSGTPTDGQKLSIRIKDSGSGQTISWSGTSGGYRAIGTTLPTSIAAGKTIYVGCVWNAADSFWDVVAVATQV